VFDLPTFSLLVTEYLMMRRLCACGHLTTADLPPGVRGWPDLLHTERERGGHAVGVGRRDRDQAGRRLDVRAARRHVSTGFVSSCLVHLDTALTTAGFEDALKDALREADVLGTDETPAPVTDQATRAPGCHSPNVHTVRMMRARPVSPSRSTDRG
jgi:hypothetical protein